MGDGTLNGLASALKGDRAKGQRQTEREREGKRETLRETDAENQRRELNATHSVLSGLTELELSSCNRISDGGVAHLTKLVPNLLHLRLAECGSLTDDCGKRRGSEHMDDSVCLKFFYQWHRSGGYHLCGLSMS